MEARKPAGADKKSEHVFDLLSPFVDGETSMDETRHIERHIAACSLCSGQLAFLRATARTLRHASDALPSPSLFERIARATYEKPTLGARVSAFLRPVPVRMALGGALAAGLVAAVMVPRLTTVSQVQTAGKSEPAHDLASVTEPTQTGKTPTSPSVKTPSGGQSALASNVKNAAQAKPFALSPQNASLGVSLARNLERYLPSSVAPRSAPDERSTLVTTVTRPTPRSNRATQAPSVAPVVKHPEALVQASTNIIPPAAARLLRSQATKLLTTRNTSIVSTIGELASRSNASRSSERTALPKVEMPSAVAAVVAPDPVKPTSQPEENSLPNPVVDTPRPTRRNSGFSLAGAGTSAKSGGLSFVSSRPTSSATERSTSFVSIVDAPMGSK